MLVMRSSPHGGIHCTVGRAASACSRSVPASPPRGAWSSAMNHCSVARKSVGFLQRQQCGIRVRERTSATSAPRSFRSAMIRGFASQTVRPGEVRDLGDEAPVVVDRVVDRQPERPAELVVLLAVARRDVDQAGPRVHRDERGARDPARALDPRMPVLEPRELGPLERPRGAAADLSRATPGDARRRGRRPRRASRRPTSSATYFSLGFTATARLAGSVHGVVVQMTIDGRGRGRRGPGRRRRRAGTSRRPTASRCSSYSTSAWASAVLQCMHQCTGLRPL